MKIKHLKRLQKIHSFEKESKERFCLECSEEDKEEINNCLGHYTIADEGFAVMCPGSADQAKRWSKQGFASVADYLKNDLGLTTIFVGDETDRPVVQSIQKLMDCESINLCGRTNLIQTAEIVRRSKMNIVNDSAVLHIASYLNRPVFAMFGYTDPIKYGPWSDNCMYLQAKGSPITDKSTTEDKVKLIESISADDVIRCIKYSHGKIEFLQT